MKMIKKIKKKIKYMKIEIKIMECEGNINMELNGLYWVKKDKNIINCRNKL